MLDQDQQGLAARSVSDEAFRETVRRIARTTAGQHADAVDREARFPVEAIAAIRDARLLSAFVPEPLGGAGVSLAAVADACFELGRHCSATAMIFAMHQIQVILMQRHRDTWFEDYLARVASQQRLIASITSEQGTGGDMGRSIAPLSPVDGGRLAFEKRALTISYGAHADDYFTTLRRSSAAQETDQVFVLHHGEDTRLTPDGGWDTLGMRGTCSPSFTVQGHLAPEQVLSAAMSDVMSETLPVSFVLWSHAWLGIATAAFERAHAFVRAAARRQPGTPLAAATALSHLSGELSLFRASVRAGLEDFLALSRDSSHEMSNVLRFNNLKITASEQAPRICLGALQIVGVVGYRNDSPFSVGRHLRDALSAGLMVSNDRIHAVDAGLIALSKSV